MSAGKAATGAYSAKYLSSSSELLEDEEPPEDELWDESDSELELELDVLRLRLHPPSNVEDRLERHHALRWNGGAAMIDRSQ